MWLAPTFPFLFGSSKISLARKIIEKPIGNLGAMLHFSCLILFDSNPVLTVPIAQHNQEQVQAINERLQAITHGTGTALFKALNFCECLIDEFIKVHGNDYQVLLHLFTDGEDNASSDEVERKKLEKESELIRSHKDLLHRFYYSFSDFEVSKRVGEALQATVIMVDSENVTSPVALRNKHIFSKTSAWNDAAERKRLLKPKGAYNLLDGDNPVKLEVTEQLVSQLRRFATVFNGKMLSEEGLFRQNANKDTVELTTEKFSQRQDELGDYDDPIQIAHTFKNFLRKYKLIPELLQNRLIDVVSSNASNEMKESEIRDIVSGLPRNNAVCLSIVLDILRRVLAAQSAMLDQSKALNDDGLARIFSGILFAEALTFGPNDTTHVAALKIMNAKDVILALIRFTNFADTIK